MLTFSPAVGSGAKSSRQKFTDPNCVPTDVTLRRLNTPVNIHPGVNAAVSNFQVPQTLGFGTVIAPIMYRIDYADGRWGEPQLLPYGPVSLDPAAKIFHWAQIIFEGLKAYFC